MNIEIERKAPIRRYQYGLHSYKINDIFISRQGEGYNAWMEAVFVRFAGCNLNCSWCDTDYKNYKEMNINDILEEIDKYGCRNIILTGGEPCMQNIEALVRVMKREYYIALETNGTYPLDGLRKYIDYIAVSPKTENIDDTIRLADEIRIVNTHLEPKDILKWEKYNVPKQYISVLDVKDKFNLDETIELLTKVNERSKARWMLNQQQHKILRIP